MTDSETQNRLYERPWLDEVFYHIYPLGFCGAPEYNRGDEDRGSRFDVLTGALDHISGLGCTAVYLGPVFESTKHGYDTADYFHCDRRLGTNEELAGVIGDMHERGMRVVLDGVFNHVGRDFHAFVELQRDGAKSDKREWFRDVRFDASSPFGDPFAYAGWEGNFELVELNLEHRAVRDHLFDAVRFMIHELGIDGLRLDVAYSLPTDFIRELREVCDEAFSRRLGTTARFFLLGEVIHGDYGTYIGPGLLDSVTNYECYKGAWSSLNDANYHEIAHSLARHFGEGGVSEGAALYNFVDNHDVDRVASRLVDARLLYPLYALLFTMPGMPSVYYGSEFALQGEKQAGDAVLRPAWTDVRSRGASREAQELSGWIAELSRVRSQSRALREGTYGELSVSHREFAFFRKSGDEAVVVALNAGEYPTSLELTGLSRASVGTELVSLFDDRTRVPVSSGAATVKVPAGGCVIARLQG